MPDPFVAVGWRPSSFFGWGVFGLNLVLELEAAGAPLPVICARLVRDDVLVDGLRAQLLARSFARSEEHQRSHGVKAAKGMPFLMPLFNGLSDGPPNDHSFGFIFLENTAIPAEAARRANRFRRILAGSSWNAQVLQAHGVARVATVLQGVDTSLFCPGPRRGFFSDRFVVFSGGKLEYRKGQDIVVAAFKRFRQRHADAVLAFCWSNPFPQSMASMAASPHGVGVPAMAAQGGDFAGWLLANGLPAGSFIDLGFTPNPLMPAVFREMDLAVFPNRCEGGTNLVAMEAMASGLPVVLSGNTGHLDLVGADNCLVLTRQAACAAAPAGVGCDGWGESDVDELVAAMETVYADRARARALGVAASASMQALTWKAQTAALLAALA